MRKPFKASKLKTYGNGFDGIFPEDHHIRAFIAWWNDRSHFPVEEYPSGDSRATDFPTAT